VAERARRELERAVHALLIIGGGASALLLLCAVALSLVGRRPLDAGAPRRLAELGMEVLMLTPAARVVGSLVVFVHLRDRRYVVITATVLALMLAGFLLGKG
jgi:uncharacterized membrane protein